MAGLSLPARVSVAWRAIALGSPGWAADTGRQALMAVAGWGEADGHLLGDGGDREQLGKTGAAAERLLAAAVSAASDQPPAGGEQETKASPAWAFFDPAMLGDLEAVVARWLDRNPELAVVLAEQVTELQELLPAGAAEVIGVERAESLARCHGLLLGPGDEQDGPDDDSGALIRRFAADPSVTSAHAEAARRWADTIHFGLWQLDEPPTEPAGRHLLDLVTSMEHFVPLDPAALGLVGRWSVLLGALVCVDGVWRPAAPLLPLSPVEGDALAELVRRMSDVVTAELSGRPRRPGRARTRPAPFGTAPPRGVTAAGYEAPPPEVARVLSMIVGSGLTRLIGEVAAYRLAGPRLQNTDGDPMVLVKATLAAGDLNAATARLASHPDIAADADTPESFTWWGRELTAAEREPMLAQAAAQLGVDADGFKAGGAAQRWLRGRVTRQGQNLVLETNSLERLDRFGELLRGLGVSPTLVSKTTMDPAQDMVLPHGHLLPAAMDKQAAQAWAQHWLDEHIPALKGRTPRQAAASDRHRPQLEALLRHFEWQHDMHGHASQATDGGDELAWLREQLDMPGLS